MIEEKASECGRGERGKRKEDEEGRVGDRETKSR